MFEFMPKLLLLPSKMLLLFDTFELDIEVFIVWREQIRMVRGCEFIEVEKFTILIVFGYID